MDHEAPNTQYFNNIYFGKVDKHDTTSKFIFRDKKTKLTWNIKQNKDSLVLNSIEKFITKKEKDFFSDYYNINSSLKEPVIYEKFHNYKTINIKCLKSEGCYSNEIILNPNQNLNRLIVNFYNVNKNKIKNVDFEFKHNYFQNYNIARFKKNRVRFH